MLHRLPALLFASAAALSLFAPGAAYAAEPNNLVPACDAWSAGRTFYEPTWATGSTSACTAPGHGDATSMRVAAAGGQSAEHWEIEGAKSPCVQTPGISADPRPMSFAYYPHVHMVQFGLSGPGMTLHAIAHSGPGCTGSEAPRTVSFGGGNPDTWHEQAGSVTLPAGTASVHFEVSIQCPTGNTCLEESGGDPSYVLVDDLVLGGDGQVVTDCDDPELATMTEVPGDLVIDDVAGCGGDLELPALVQVGGDLVITDSDAGAISVGSLTTVGGDLTIGDNTGAEAISVGSLTTVVGSLDITGNTSAGSISLEELMSVGVTLDITGNAATGTVTLGELDEVANGLHIETGGDLDLGGVSVGGDLDITGLGSDSVSATTGGGLTQVTILGGTAAMEVTLREDTFALPVDFTIERTGDEPASGQIDPVSGYSFRFDVPTLNQDALLDFTIDLSKLDAATRSALLAGVANGRSTLVVRGDSAGAQYQALPRCGAGQRPEDTGCVTVEQDGELLRFTGVAGHFSTYAVAVVTPKAVVAPPDVTPTPSNAFRFGKLRRNKRRGTAALAVMLPGRGELVLRGRGVRALKRSVAGKRASLPIRLTSRARRRLQRTGRVAVKLRVVYTPAGGGPRAKTKRVTLVKRLLR